MEMKSSIAKIYLRAAAGLVLAMMFACIAIGQTPMDGEGNLLAQEGTVPIGERNHESSEPNGLKAAVLDSSDSADRSSFRIFTAEIVSKRKVPQTETNYRQHRSTVEDDPVAAQDQPAPPTSNGSSPVDLITRIEMKYQFQNFGSGYMHGVPIVRVDYAFSKAVGLRVDLPVLHFDSKVPGQQSQSGIGDVVTSMTFVKMVSKRFIFGVVPRIDFPTASKAALGSGKYSFKPTVAGLTPLAPGLAFGTALEYRISFAGKQNRADIHELSIKPLFLKSFLKGPLKGFYANPQLEGIIDFETNNRTTWQAAVHMGKILTKQVVVFWIPTVHIGGTKRESFKFEAGFRYLFR